MNVQYLASTLPRPSFGLSPFSISQHLHIHFYIYFSLIRSLDLSRSSLSFTMAPPSPNRTWPCRVLAAPPQLGCELPPPPFSFCIPSCSVPVSPCLPSFLLWVVSLEFVAHWRERRFLHFLCSPVSPIAWFFVSLSRASRKKKFPSFPHFSSLTAIVFRVPTRKKKTRVSEINFSPFFRHPRKQTRH